MKKIIITAPVHDYLKEQFRRHGFEVYHDPAISYDELYEIAHDCWGLVVTTRIAIDRRMIDQCRSLQWIGRLGSGMELIDVEYATANGIECFSSPEGNRDAVAEHCLGLLLALMNNIVRSHNQVKAFSWMRNENRGFELNGKTVGIVGFGNTGSSFARLLAPFGVTVLAFDKYRFGFGGSYIKEASFEQVCKYANVISFHVPLSDETRKMANAGFFSKLEQKPFLLNTSRGGVVDVSAMFDAYRSGKILGAALDVLPNENLSTFTEQEKELLKQITIDDNIIITPHIAGYSHEAFYKMAKVLFDKISSKAWFREGIVNGIKK